MPLVYLYMNALICKSSYFLSYSDNNIVKTGIKLLKSPLLISITRAMDCIKTARLSLS